MKKILLITLLLMTKSIFALEVDYQKPWCLERNGLFEYKIYNPIPKSKRPVARVDCLLPTMAVEFDFGYKIDECIQQASKYSRWTNRQGVCALITSKGSRYDLRIQNQREIYTGEIKYIRIEP